MHKGKAGQVLHGRSHTPLHGHQLQAAELTLPLLKDRGQRSSVGQAHCKTHIGSRGQLGTNLGIKMAWK